MKKNDCSRRDFIRKSVGISGGTVMAYNLYPAGNNIANSGEITDNISHINKLPREVAIATVSLEGIKANNPFDMLGKIMDILERNVPIYQPDIICLPEFFPFANNVEKTVSLQHKVEISSNIVDQLSLFAKKNNCNLITPLYTNVDGKTYNSAVLIDRNGKYSGEYRKIHTTIDEMNEGVSPGSTDQSVLKTDFGTIGIQICFDIEWEDGWKRLRDERAEIIFWPSAFSGGCMVNTQAWKNRCVVVSSTCKDTSKICDMTGETIAETGRWNMNFISGSVNLEKAFLHTWPAVSQFDNIRKKYGKKIRLRTFHEEEWSVLESLSPDVVVADILKEFNIKTRQELLHDSEKRQNELRF